MTSKARGDPPGTEFLAEVEQHSGQPVSRCFQCRKCTNGCPLAFDADYLPNQVMRMIQRGLRDELLRSRAIWICASCQTCTTRCPNDIDVARSMDTLRQLSRAAGVPAGEPDIVEFHDAFLDSVRRHGRVFELGMVGRYKLQTGQLGTDLRLGLTMLRKGKLKLRPPGVEGKHEVRALIDRSRPRPGR